LPVARQLRCGGPQKPAGIIAATMVKRARLSYHPLGKNSFAARKKQE
jgi:hypothetical protein